MKFKKLIILFYIIPFFIKNNISEWIYSIFNINTINSKKNCCYEVYDFYLHTKGVKNLSLQIACNKLINEEDKKRGSFYIILFHDGSIPHLLTSERNLLSSHRWTLIDKSNETLFLEMVQINENTNEYYEVASLFSKKSLRFGTLYKVNFIIDDRERENNFINFSIINSCNEFSLCINKKDFK